MRRRPWPLGKEANGAATVKGKPGRDGGGRRECRQGGEFSASPSLHAVAVDGEEKLLT